MKNKAKRRALKRVNSKNWGVELVRAINEKGISKVHIAKSLGYSRVWLDELIKTGNFTEEKLKIVKKICK